MSRVQSPGFRVQGSGFRVQGSGFRVQGSRFRVQGRTWHEVRARLCRDSGVPARSDRLVFDAYSLVQGLGLGFGLQGVGLRGQELGIRGSG